MSKVKKRVRKPIEPTRLEAWVVLRAWPFTSITVDGVHLKETAKGEPARFMPVFTDYDEAKAWLKGCPAEIVHITLGNNP